MKLILSLITSFYSLIILADNSEFNLIADSTHAPFYYGVASGDPMDNKVIIWTHITTNQPVASVVYEMATDSLFTNIIANGSFITNDSLDYTVKIDVAGLSANTTYFYRFKDNNNNYSVIGRTKTAPNTAVSDLKFAVVSCSSIYSGYFNSYRSIAGRSDLNAIIHLGDYIYEDMVFNEEVRVPANIPVYQPPINKEQWRTIHKFWLLDPDLRAARQRHPFIQLWDNHDTDGLHFDCKESSEAFMNWTPTRENTTNYQKIYRQLKYGSLLDVFILDIALWRGIDVISGADKSCLGNEQFNWFKNAIQTSTAKWKIVGSQKMFSHWSVPSLATILGNGGVVNPNSWDGCVAERDRILNLFDSNNINNVVLISGDSHVSLAADVPYTPFDSNTYNDTTGFGSLCIEFAPASISRGNFDEKGLSESLINTVLQFSNEENINQHYLELTKHGYGIMHFNNDSLKAQYWYCDILEKNNLDTLGKELVVFNGENHWKRKSFTPNSINEKNIQNKNIFISKPYPNPADKEVSFDIEFKTNENFKVSIVQMLNYKQYDFKLSKELKNVKKEHVVIPINDFSKGIYILMIEGESFYKGQLFYKM